MALKSNGVTQVPDGLGLPGKVLRVNSSGTAGEWGDAVDGRNSVSDGTKLDSIEAGATADQTKADIEGLGIDVPATNLTGTIPAARLSTATTQAESDDSTKIATTAYVVDKITTLIGGAPSTLNDLNELAAAINDDANYNSTLTTALATKLPLAGGTITGDVSFTNGNKAVFGGTGNGELEIYAHATNNNVYISENGGSGNLNLGADNFNIYTNAFTKQVASFTAGSAKLLNDGNEKLATTATGIDVTGNATFADNGKAIFGAGSDLEVYHNGTDSRIAHTGTGHLVLSADNFRLRNNALSQDLMQVNAGGNILLYHNGALKFATTATGINVTGTIEHTYGGVAWQHGEGNFRPVSRKLYSEAGSVGTTGSNITDVYGEADLSAIDSNATFAYAAAWEAVETHGARLPTLSELLDGVGMGSGQSYDSEYLWTCTPAGPHHVWVAPGAHTDSKSPKIVDITDAAEVYRTRGFFDVSRDNRVSTYSSDGHLRDGNDRVFHDGYHPNADTLTTARSIALTGAVTGTANFDGSVGISIATTATADPTLTLAGDATGSATFTNLGNATLTVAIADDSHNHTLANIDQVTINNTNDLDTYNTRGLYNWSSSNPANSPYAYGSMLVLPDGSQSQQLLQTYGGTANTVSLYGRRKTSGTWDTTWTQYFSDHYHPNADTLTTARNINGVAFDGSIDITVADATKLPLAGGTLTGNLAISNTTPVLSINDTNNGSGGGFIGHIEFNNTSGESFRIGDWAAVDETSTGGPDVLRLRNSNGTRTVFEWGQAGTTAGSLYAYNQRVFADNYHPNADTLTTARTINGVAFNGSANITVADDTKLPLAGGTITGDLTVNDTLRIASNNVGTVTDLAFTSQAAVVGENNMSFGLTNNTDGYYRWMFGNTTNTGGTAGATEKMKLDKDGNLTLSGTVDGRDLAADGNKLDDIETGATADQTAAQILTAIKTVDGSSSGLDADNLDGVTWGNINTTLQTSSNIKAYNGTTEIKSDGIYFESGNHCMTWNDGKGNFNIRMGHNTNEVSTETGYASHIEWSQSSGWMQVNATNASVTAGDAVTWDQTWQYTFSNGQFSSPGDVVAYSSDRRLKTNIKNIDNALDKVLKLNGVYFNWADDINDKGFYGANPGEIAVGVIAQEVEVVLPELVAPAPFDQHHDTETGEALGSKSGQDYKTVKYEKLTALLIEAVKELSAKVDLQQEEIDRLKRQ
jgi:hypothetical protein